ncbi:MAG: hypothetical protein WCP53_16090, partial [Verrucomicrobiota bacterium]
MSTFDQEGNTANRRGSASTTPLHRREFIGVMAAGVAVAHGLPRRALAAPVASPASPKLWIDPRFATLPQRPWRKIHLDFHNTQH